MSDVLPISGTAGSAGAAKPATRQGQRGAAPQLAIPTDRVEISEVAQALSTLEPENGIRADKVAAIREAIADGTYETDAKINYTVSRLLEVLR